MKLFSKTWYWLAVIAVLILAAGITTLFPQTNDVVVSEETTSPNNTNEVDPTTKADPQQENPASPSTMENVHPATNVELQRLFNDLRKEYLDTRDGTINWWLQFITTILAFFGIVVVVLGYFGLQEFKRLRDDAEKDVTKIEEHSTMVSKEFQKFRDEGEQLISEMRAHIAAIRKGREEFDQESDGVRQKARERLDASVFDMLSGNKEFEELLDDFRQIRDLSRVDEVVLDAYTLQQDGKIEEAIQKWHSIANIEEGTDNDRATQAWKSIGYLYLEIDNTEEALSAFDNAIRLKRDDIEVYVRRGNVRSFLGDYRFAIADFDDAIRLGANLEEMYTKRANAKYGLDKYDEAIVDCDEAIRLNPDYTEAYMVRGEARVGLQESSEAITNFQRALELAVNQEQENLIDRIEQRLRELRSDGENL